NVDWRLHQDIPVPRPPEPQKSGQSLAQLFQNARSLADQGHYDAAKQSFRNIKQLDFVEWGDECEQWIKRITSYSYIVDLAAHDSTLERARRAWQEHERL